MAPKVNNTGPQESEYSRVYCEHEKTEFLAAFGRLGQVSSAAREVGVKAAKGRQWLIAAGIEPKQRGRERRAEYFRLRAAGVSRHEAARAVGLNPRTAMDWDQGIVHADNRRVYPDGRVVDYNRKVIPANDS